MTERNVVRVTADGVIVIEDGASDEELDRAFTRLAQCMTGDLHGLHASAPRGSNIIGSQIGERETPSTGAGPDSPRSEGRTDG